ncbi:RICIN domain-containing protein [Streptomyces abikoensis]|uniref:RICIN domain-containing protein n=1 Tax=Streptomyces abikoensis TaxID=97398 RepID=UPI0033DF8513
MAPENERTGLVLDAPNTAGNRVTTSLDRYNLRQRFRAGTVRGHNSVHPDLCLTGAGNEEPVGALACDDSPAQQWWDNSRAVDAQAWEPGDKLVRLRAWNGLYLDTFGRSDRDGTALSTSRADKAGTQRWDIRYAGHRWQVETYGDGTLRFRNDRAHLCLVPPARETAYVTIEKCGDDARQRWTVVP